MNLKDKGEVLRFEEIANGYRQGNILDIGGAEGELHSFLKNKFNEAEVYCLDYEKKEGVDFLVDVNKDNWENSLCFQYRKFDTIIAAEIIEYLDSPIKFIESCYKLLSPQGRFILTTPNATSLIYLKNSSWGAIYGGHQQTFTKGILEFMMIKSNFIIVKSSYVNAFMFNWLGYFICKVIKRLRGDIVIVGERFER